MVEFDYFSKSLQEWYLRNKRDLPWRDTKDPYKIWLSEVILQQTQVSQGLPYFEKFSRNYPNIADLANAEEDQVMRDWQGLGYYSRARNLQHAARHIHSELNGKFPDNYNDIIKLKGIGPYTAAAIASFAFGESKAVVDGNVIRVLSRFFGLEEAVNETETRKRLQELADAFIDSSNPDIHNQAIMELGALLCKPASPDCLSCPLSEGCVAYKKDLLSKIPYKSSKIKIRERYLVYMVIRRSDEILMRKRESKDVWAGLYDMPLLELNGKMGMESLIEHRDIRSVVSHSKEIREIQGWQKHQLSHQRIWAKFLILHLEDELPAELPDSFKGAEFYTIDESRDLGKPILIVNFLNQYIY